MSETKKDRMVLGPKCSKGHQHVTRIRQEPDGVYASDGICIPVKEGQVVPPGAELVQIKRTDDGSYDCETIYRHDGSVPSGPAKVTSDAYRGGWDALWGADKSKLN